VTSILIVTALLVVPGLGAALAFAPPAAVSIETRVGLVVGLGYALVAGVAMVLALTQVLSRVTFVVGVIVIASAAWALAFRRASPRAYASAFSAQAREAPFALATGLIVIGAVASTWPLYPVGNNFNKHAPWRYWADGLEVAAAGHVPATTNQWGAELPTAVDKVVLDAFEAGASFLIGPSPLMGMRAILTVAAIGLAAALLGLGRELGLRAFAPLVPALVLLFPGNVPVAREFAEDLTTYKAEDIGRVVALTALLVGMYALTKARSRLLAAAAGGIFALAALTHGVSGVVAIAMLVLYALATVLIDRTHWRSRVVIAVVIVAVSAVGYVGMIRLSGGDLGFQRVTSGPTVAGFPPDIDPARSFDTGEVVRIPPNDGRFFIPTGEIATRYAQTTVGSHSNSALGALALGILAVATVIFVLLEVRLLPLAVVSWGLVATMIGGALFFSYRYDTQIPGDFGVRRLYDYAVLPTALTVAAVLDVIASRLSGRRFLLPAAVFVVAVALVVASAVDRIPGRAEGRQPTSSAAAINQVASVVPCGARMLPNARSAGAWEATTGRRSILEGLAPYLRPEVTNRVLPTVIGAREFFRDPVGHRAFLAHQNVDYIILLRPNVRIGNVPPYSTHVNAIVSLPGARVISESRSVKVIAIGSSATETTAVQPRRCPI
jgi:hypothetical protein